MNNSKDSEYKIGREVTDIMVYYNKVFNSTYSYLVHDTRYGSVEQLIKKALQIFTVEDIKKGIDNFKKDKWYKDNLQHRPMMFFKDTATVEKFINVQTQKDKMYKSFNQPELTPEEKEQADKARVIFLNKGAA